MLDSNFFPLDLYSLLRILFTALIIAAGFLHLLKNAASKFFVDGNFEEELLENMESSSTITGVCYVCGISASKQCARCKIIMYCSTYCQSKHWTTEHKVECKPFKSINSSDLSSASNSPNGKRKSSGWMSSNGLSNSLMPSRRPCKVLEQSNKVLFPYDEFEKLFKWDNLEYAPCGLLNCGNSCYANVVLQCLACTKPLVAYLLEKRHSKECNRNDWCFLCELQSHICRVSQTRQPFSPMSMLSRLPNIGGSLGYGRQEDAHEFMRFAIDTMQTVFLDEFGGEKALGPVIQETTLIQHIFGGDLQSQVLCTQCSMVSNRYENMMDLTVEIHGDAGSLEDCLIQFTGKEPLDGENMYKCDGCNGYVKAWKRLTIHRPPNILTIALKRFQSGRYGKLNKRVTFPETLDLGPYMSGNATDDFNVYSLYAVVVHLDKLNASFCGHYICYTKDFSGNWYWIDDCKVMKVDLEVVLTQRAYMLLYRRNTVRKNTIKPEISVSKGDSEKLVESVKSPSESDLLSGKIHECLDARSDSKLLEDHYDGKLNATCKDMREEAEMNNFNATRNPSPTSVKQVTHSNDLEEIVPAKIIIEESATNQYCTGINAGNVNVTEDIHHENESLEISPKDLDQKMGLVSNLEDEFKQKIVDMVDLDEDFPFSPSGFTNAHHFDEKDFVNKMNEPIMSYNISSSEYCYESIRNLNSSSSDCLESSVLKPNSGTYFSEQKLQLADINRISTEKDDVLESGNIKCEKNLNLKHDTECLEKIYPFFSTDSTGKVPCMDSLIMNGKKQCNSIEATNRSSMEESSDKVSDYGENLETFHHECKDDVLPGIEPLLSPLFDRSSMNSSSNNCEISAENEKVRTILFTDAHSPLFERAPLNNSKSHELSSKNDKVRKASIAVQVTKEEENHLYNTKCNGLDNHGSSSESCENGRTPKLSNEIPFLKPGFLNPKLPSKSTTKFENNQVKQHSRICISGKLEMNGNGYVKDGCSDQSNVELLEPQKILVPSVDNGCGINIDSTKPLFSSGFLNKPRKTCLTSNGALKLVHNSCKYETCSKGPDNTNQNGKV